MQHKRINIIVILIFALLILVPLACTNTKKGYISDFDNRALADDPVTAWKDGKGFPGAAEDYLMDRIGFRRPMIDAYVTLNDKVWGILAHPMYMYGRDKNEIFFTGDTFRYDDYEFLDRFADLVAELQTYCNDRGIPFVFQYEPDKSAIRTALLPKGLNYDTAWVDYLFRDLDARGVTYVNNTDMLKELDASGADVYNHKYDAGHFNDNAAYYSVNAALTALQAQDPAVHVNDPSEIAFETTVEHKLKQSDYIIDETVPKNGYHGEWMTNVSSDYEGTMYVSPKWPAIESYTNSVRSAEGAPTALVFGGSHIEYEYKYLQNSFSQYSRICNYYNVLNYDYYIEKFQPDVVIFEVSQRTINEDYFPLDEREDLRAEIEAFEAARQK